MFNADIESSETSRWIAFQISTADKEKRFTGQHKIMNSAGLFSFYAFSSTFVIWPSAVVLLHIDKERRRRQ